MMKKRILAILLSLGCILSCTACGDTPTYSNGAVYNVPGEKKTTIRVTNFDGGIGTVWLDKAAERFAELNQTKSYATGKQGIYVNVERASSINLSSTGSWGDIAFTERSYDVTALAQLGVLLNIDDVITDTTRSGGSIDSLIYENKKASLKGHDGQYYGLPHYEFFGGLSYDHEFFEKENIFIAGDSVQNASVNVYTSSYGTLRLVKDSSVQKSVGPDGQENTADDGLPSSMEELIQVMAYIKNKTDYGAVVVGATVPNYTNYLIAGLWASLAGYQQMINYYNCTGEIEIVDSLSNEPLFKGIDYIKKPNTRKVVLSENTGFLGNNMAAKYYAISLMEIMLKEGFLVNSSFSGTDHYGAEKSIIYNPIDSQYDKVAMLIEATYWYNEATIAGSFTSYETLAKTKEERDLRFMALPNSFNTIPENQRTEQKNVIMDIGIGIGVANAKNEGNEEIVSAVKDFIAFLYSSEELINFTVETGMTRPLTYDVGEQASQMVGFYEKLWNLRQGANVIYWSGTTSAFKQTKNYLKIVLELPKNPDKYNNYLTALRAGEGWTTETLFNETKYTETEWKNYYNENLGN